MNSKDISAQKFEKVSFGYNQEDVDDYLNRVAAEFGQLERENAEINKKLQKNQKKWLKNHFLLIILSNKLYLSGLIIAFKICFLTSGIFCSKSAKNSLISSRFVWWSAGQMFLIIG